MPKYPNKVRAGAGKSAVAFEHQPDLYAVRRESGSGLSGALAVMQDDANAAYAVYERRSGHKVKAADAGPVYSAGPGGPLAVPTGRVFVRMSEGMRPEDRRAQFRAAGFEIERTLSYAPNAAWLRPVQGGVSRALPALGALESVPDVAHVEPQMLLARALKG